MAFRMYEMANLRTKTTGLPVSIWISTKGYIKHSARIKVSRSYGDRIRFENFFTITVSDNPKIIGDVGDINSEDVQEVISFVIKNQEMLLSLWNEEISPIDFTDSIK